MGNVETILRFSPLIFFGLGLSTGPSALVDLYVDLSADCASGNGTAANPFCTVTEAVAAAASGDVIRIAPGTYVENLALSVDLELIGTEGDALTRLDGGMNGSVITVTSSAVVRVEGLTVTNGLASGGGGGFSNAGTLTIENSTISGNSSSGYSSGGGVLQRANAGPLTIRNSKIEDNFAGGAGGGVLGRDSGPVLIEGTTLSGNQANDTGAVAVWNGSLSFQSSIAFGNGALYGGAIRTIESEALIVNSTISGNDCTGFDNYGIFGKMVEVRNSTITGNVGEFDSGGIVSYYGPPVTVRNSIIAGNTTQPGTDIDVNGPFVSLGHNLVGIGTGVPAFVNGQNGDLVGSASAPLDAGLLPLADNGGPTQTRALGPMSPARDAGDPVTFEANDQRGRPRLAGSADIGSFEASIGTPILGCTAVPNSTGEMGATLIEGAASVGGALTLRMVSIPKDSTAFFVVSSMGGFVANPSGSQGNLCLGGTIGRYVGPGQVLNSGAAGEASLTIDATQIPQATGFVSAQAGETWNFQGWHRDSVGGAATSNFALGHNVTF